MRGFDSSKLRIHAMRQKACRMVSAPTLLVMLVATGVQPGYAQAMSLEEALTSAYLTNPTILSHRARLQAVDEAVPQALSGWRPEVEILGDYERRRSRQNFDPREEIRDVSGARLRITQNIYNGGQTTASIDAAEADVLAERFRLYETERDVLREAVRTYLDVYRDTAILALRRQSRDRLQRQQEIVQARFRVGEVTTTDVAQAESRLARAVSDVARAEGALDSSRSEFLKIVGVPPADLEEPPSVSDIPATLDAAISLAKQESPDVLAAKHGHEAALARVDVEMADMLPKLDLIGEGGYLRNQSVDGTYTELGRIITELRIPLYQAGFEASQIRAAKKRVAEARQSVEEERRRATERAMSAWGVYEATRREIAAVEKEARAARVALEGVQQEAVAGQRTVLDILNAEQDVSDAQVLLAQARHDLALARYDVLAAIGRLSARGLGLDVELYDPRAHYDEVRNRWWGLGESVQP